MAIEHATAAGRRDQSWLVAQVNRCAWRLLFVSVFLAAGLLADDKPAPGAARPGAEDGRTASIRDQAGQPGAMRGAVLRNSPPRRSQVLPGTITTVAGTGDREFSGDGGPATEAELRPLAVAVDGAGNLYIADYGNSRVRRVDAEGTITTVAGTGDSRFSGDGGPATEAGLDPRAVAVDGAGNLYIADYDNHRVRRVDAEGTITTVAGSGDEGFSGDGGPATEAGLDPRAVAVDGAGNLYIADHRNRRVRRVDAEGTITTVAGSGDEGFSGDGGPATEAGLDPRAVAVDGAGNLYIADQFNRRVRRVDAEGTITTVAGSGSTEFSGDWGPATEAGFYTPNGLAVDGAGNLYIADGRLRVRRVDAEGTITTVAGTGDWIFSGNGGPATEAGLSPRALAVDGAGNLYIADYRNSRVRRVEQPSLAPASPGPWTTSVETLDVSVLAARAEQGSLEAQYRYGMLLWFGFGVRQDAAESTAWIRRAAEGGHAEATVALIERYLGADGSEPDGLEAARWVRGQAEGGSAAAQLLLGKMHQAGTGVAQSMPEAVRWIRAAAEQGSAAAARQLGLLYRTGSGVSADESEASRWYAAGSPLEPLDEGTVGALREAAENGSADAQNYFLAAHYELGQYSARPELAPGRFLDMLRAAAEGGEARAEYYVGLAHFQGHGVPLDHGAARRWLARAAGQGDERSALKLSEMLAAGRGGAADAAESARWLEAAAERGEASAGVRLAERYLSGAGVARDDSAALGWLARASGAAGGAGEEALFAQALMHLYGADVVPELLGLAIAAVRERAEGREDAVAQAYLGLLHYHGRGVEQDDAAAVKWLRSAAEGGHEPASWYLERLAELDVAAAAGQGVGPACEGCSGTPGGGDAKYRAASVRGADRAAEHRGAWRELGPPPGSAARAAVLDLCGSGPEKVKGAAGAGYVSKGFPIPAASLTAACGESLAVYGRVRARGGVSPSAVLEAALHLSAATASRGASVPASVVSIGADVLARLDLSQLQFLLEVLNSRELPAELLKKLKAGLISAAIQATVDGLASCGADFDLRKGGRHYSAERRIRVKAKSLGSQLGSWSSGGSAWTGRQLLYKFASEGTVSKLGLPDNIKARALTVGCIGATVEVELEFESPVLGMEFVWVPGGTFQMGTEAPGLEVRDGKWFNPCVEAFLVCTQWTYECSESREKADACPKWDEFPQHGVTVGGFWMGKHKVTWGQWAAVLPRSGGVGQDERDYPRFGVSRSDATTFLERLNELVAGAGRGERYGLPSEAEWEYAARAGVSGLAGERYGSIEAMGCDHARDLGGDEWVDEGAVPVGTYAANRWGLEDLFYGQELTADWYRSYPGAPSSSRVDLSPSSTRYPTPVARGGASDCRAANRYRSNSHTRTGFRLRRTE